MYHQLEQVINHWKHRNNSKQPLNIQQFTAIIRDRKPVNRAWMGQFHEYLRRTESDKMPCQLRFEQEYIEPCGLEPAESAFVRARITDGKVSRGGNE